jgi:cell division protein ZapA
MAERTKSGADEPTAVTIFGRTYCLRGGGDASYLEELASIVDGKMQEVAEATGTADTLKLAILAALNLADEYFGAGRRDPSSRDADGERRLARMVTLLDEALAG